MRVGRIWVDILITRHLLIVHTQSVVRMLCHLFHLPSFLSTLCQHQKSFQRPSLQSVRALRTNAAWPFHPPRTLIWPLVSESGI